MVARYYSCECGLRMVEAPRGGPGTDFDHGHLGEQLCDCARALHRLFGFAFGAARGGHRARVGAPHHLSRRDPVRTGAALFVARLAFARWSFLRRAARPGLPAALRAVAKGRGGAQASAGRAAAELVFSKAFLPHVTDQQLLYEVRRRNAAHRVRRCSERPWLSVRESERRSHPTRTSHPSGCPQDRPKAPRHALPVPGAARALSRIRKRPESRYLSQPAARRPRSICCQCCAC
jgi:hypothetical protein